MASLAELAVDLELEGGVEVKGSGEKGADGASAFERFGEGPGLAGGFRLFLQIARCEIERKASAFDLEMDVELEGDLQFVLDLGREGRQADRFARKNEAGACFEKEKRFGRDRVAEFFRVLGVIPGDAPNILDFHKRFSYLTKKRNCYAIICCMRRRFKPSSLRRTEKLLCGNAAASRR